MASWKPARPECMASQTRGSAKGGGNTPEVLKALVTYYLKNRQVPATISCLWKPPVIGKACQHLTARQVGKIQVNQSYRRGHFAKDLSNDMSACKKARPINQESGTSHRSVPAIQPR